MALEVVYLEVGARKRNHQATRINSGALQTSEGDNIDQTAAAGRREITFDQLMAAGRNRACRRCFPTWPPVRS
jgi:hypothetical protein